MSHLSLIYRHPVLLPHKDPSSLHSRKSPLNPSIQQLRVVPSAPCWLEAWPFSPTEASSGPSSTQEHEGPLETEVRGRPGAAFPLETFLSLLWDAMPHYSQEKGWAHQPLEGPRGLWGGFSGGRGPRTCLPAPLRSELGFWGAGLNRYLRSPVRPCS